MSPWVLHRKGSEALAAPCCVYRLNKNLRLVCSAHRLLWVGCLGEPPDHTVVYMGLLSPVLPQVERVIFQNVFGLKDCGNSIWAG